MNWNYRVIKSHDSQDYYVIREVYYGKDNTIKYWSDDPVDPTGDTVGELKEDLELMASALSKPVLVRKEGTLVEITENQPTK